MGNNGEYLADCRARVGFDLLTNRWNSVVLFALVDGPMRPGRLRAAIGGISAKVLNETLRRLEYGGLVMRRAYAEAPPRVEDELTDLGHSFMVPIRAMGAGSAEHGHRVLEAQDRADEASATA
ncbi:helix-turn-helix transcriptional regulator [Streptomyces lunaelactis]|uniref:winged helix-turn-helix transcriptional regulator n=1 Tax=Streptomyces lunaelactis TaxID=1535768 RepID=UPI0015853F92|nr:helix-turn-helix domain-containing protein [Streptomyces lunaelactis]NUK07857.1 helix-turn-helix transcriptional regulator [Streptomyces lunaelactis]